MIDRLYPPLGQERRFPIPVDITKEELELALSGRFVTRVIYLEDPQHALPVAEQPDEQTYFQIPPGDNPLDVADRLGRPMAILRLGGSLARCRRTRRRVSLRFAPLAEISAAWPSSAGGRPPHDSQQPPGNSKVPAHVPPTLDKSSSNGRPREPQSKSHPAPR